MTDSHRKIYKKALALCQKHKLMPFQPGSKLELVHIQHDRLIHDINVCFHELGHLYDLNSSDFDMVISMEAIPNLAINNMGYFIENSMSPDIQFSNELSARAIQIGLNIVYDLWPGYDELSGWTSEYSEALVREVVASSRTADAVIEIIEEFSNLPE